MHQLVHIFIDLRKGNFCRKIYNNRKITETSEPEGIEYMSYYITREKAVSLLTELINHSNLDDDIKEELEQIAICIENEDKGIFAWGADYDIEELFEKIPKQYDTRQRKLRRGKIYDKYRIREVKTIFFDCITDEN